MTSSPRRFLLFAACVGVLLVGPATPRANAQATPDASPVELPKADVASAEVAPAVTKIEETPAEAATVALAAPPEGELQSIREQLDDVKTALARSQKDNQRIFVLLFLAIIMLIANIILQQRRK